MAMVALSGRPVVLWLSRLSGALVDRNPLALRLVSPSGARVDRNPLALPVGDSVPVKTQVMAATQTAQSSGGAGALVCCTGV